MLTPARAQPRVPPLLHYTLRTASSLASPATAHRHASPRPSLPHSQPSRLPALPAATWSEEHTGRRDTTPRPRRVERLQTSHALASTRPAYSRATRCGRSCPQGISASLVPCVSHRIPSEIRSGVGLGVIAMGCAFIRMPRPGLCHCRSDKHVYYRVGTGLF